MKRFPVRFTQNCTVAFAASIVALTAFPACTKEDQEKAGATIKETFEESKAAMSKAWDNVKDYSFDKRDDFDARAKALSAKMDVQLSALRANLSEAKASASRKAALDELKNAEADYKEKLRALATASADTWDSAKANLMLAWDRLQAAYYKARAD